MQKTTEKQIFSLVLAAIFTALTVIISRFLSINVWNMSIGFSFASVMLCGMLLGPLWGGACGALADFIGAILFPFGTYFPGFTATAFVGGVLFGFIGILAKKQIKGVNFIGLAALLLLLKEGVCSLLINSLWITLLYKSPYLPTLVSRLPLCCVNFVLELAFALVLKNFLIKKVRRIL